MDNLDALCGQGIIKYLRGCINQYIEMQPLLEKRLSKLPKIFRHRIQSWRQRQKGFDYFFLEKEILCMELALILHQKYPLGKYHLVKDSDLRQLKTDLTMNERWYALQMASALFNDEMTQPQLPYLENFHIIKLHLLWSRESWIETMYRTVRYRNSKDYEMIQNS